MATRLPPQAQRRYERGLRRRHDRWGFILVAAAVVCAIEFIGDQGIVSLQWLVGLPASVGLTMFAGHPVRRYQGYTAPQFPDDHAER